MQNSKEAKRLELRRLYIDNDADQNESLLLSILRKGDLTELYKFLRNSTDVKLKSGHSSNDRAIRENETVDLTTALEVMLCYMTEMQAQLVVELTTPRYAMAGRRDVDTAILVLCYALAKRSADNAASNVDEILRRMRTCVAESILDRSLYDLDTRGEVIPHIVKGIPSTIQRTEKIPDNIMTEIKTEVLCMLMTKCGYLNEVDNRGEPILTIAAKAVDIDIQIALDLIKKFNFNCTFLDRQYTRGKTALMRALTHHSIKEVKSLVENGASVNVQDNRGFTALHAAVYDWDTRKITEITLQTFLVRLSRKKLVSRRNFIEESLKSDNVNENINVFSDERIWQVHCTKQTLVEIILASGNADVNAVDFTGKTALDHALDPRTLISKKTVALLREHGAVSLRRNEDCRVKGRRRTSLHQLIIDQLSISQYGEVGVGQSEEWPPTDTLESIRSAVEPQRKKCIILTEIGDEKGRTPLHYAAMFSAYFKYAINLTKLLLSFNSCLTAKDNNRQTPLHFAINLTTYKLLVSNGAKEGNVDKWGQTPESLFRLRCLAYDRQRKLREDISQNLSGVRLKLYARKKRLRGKNREQSDAANTSSDDAKVPSGQTPSSSEAEIWKIYNAMKEPLRCVRLLECINTRLQELMTRTARAIGQRDSRFKCESKLIGSAKDGTKIKFPGDFDFYLNLTELSRYCEAVPSITTSPGYVHLRKNTYSLEEDEFRNRNFDEFFNEEQLLLTNKVNCAFKFHLVQVLNDPDFWKNEDLFELDMLNEPRDIYNNSEKLHSCVRIRMTHPVDDSNGDLMFIDTLLLDVVPSICAPGMCIEEALTGERCTNREYHLVFDQPQRFCPWVPYRDTFARVSFVEAETNAIKSCPSVLKAALRVVMAIIRDFKLSEHAYYMKTCLLYCAETFEKAKRNLGYGKGNDFITPRNLYFWVERILFCYAEFFNQDFLPCYFMSSFSQPTGNYLREVHMQKITGWVNGPFTSYEHRLCAAVCSNDFASDINCPRPQPIWEDFDREKFMLKLSKRLLS